jgi:hypothetical protein
MIVAGFSMEIRLQKLARYCPETGSTYGNLKFFVTSKHILTRSVSIVTDDGLDNWGSFLGRGKIFGSLGHQGTVAVLICEFGDIAMCLPGI